MTDITNTPSTAALRAKRAASAKQARAFGQGIINLALMIWMIWDLRHRSDAELNGRRKLWMMAAFAPPIGPIAYFIYLRRRNVQQEIPLSSADSAPQTDVTPL